MITDALLAVVAWVVETVTGWMPTVPVPAWLGTVGDGLDTAMSGASSMGAWLPVGLGVTVLSAVLLCVVLGFGIRVVRIIASFLTLGGGA